MLFRSSFNHQNLLLCTDANNSYKKYCKEHNIKHKALNLSKKQEYKRVISILKKIKPLNTKLSKINANLCKLPSVKAQAKLETERNKYREEIAAKVGEINLCSEQIDAFIEIIRKHVKYFQEHQLVIDEIKNELGLPISEIKKITNNWKKQKNISLKNDIKLTKTRFIDLEKKEKSAKLKIKKIDKQ